MTWGCETKHQEPSETKSQSTQNAKNASLDPSKDPYVITAIGHGEFYNAQGQIAEVTLKHLTHTQAEHLRQLQEHAKKTGTILPYQDPKKAGDLIAQGDEIDRLIERLKPPNQAWLKQVNNAVRDHYLRHLLKNSPATLEKFKHTNQNGELRTQALATTLVGSAYVQECIEEGVPVFDSIQLDRYEAVHDFTSEGYPDPEVWTNWGVVQGALVSSQWEAQLWSYESLSPNPGICLALSRWNANDDIKALGVICLGYTTSKVCYFDNIDIGNNTSLSSETFISGAALKNHIGGVCTDCHAGGNPFVVHPEEAPFINLLASGTRLTSDAWPDPIVHVDWPMNPGPINALPPVPNNANPCSQCHNSFSQTQFPDVTNQQLPRYCNDILEEFNLVGIMPPSTEQGNYAYQYGYLFSKCFTPSNPGQKTTNIPQDDEDFLSPPIVFNPIYECSPVVGVRGARLDAEVTIYKNGQAVAGKMVTDPNEVKFILKDPLEAGDQISAKQSFGSAQSAMSKIVVVRQYTDDYSEVIPPTIEPNETHECASSVGVRHIPGSFLHLYVNGNFVGGEWGDGDSTTIIQSSVDFNIGDRIEVLQRKCSISSELSAPIFPKQAPDPMPGVRLSPPTFYEGQKLVTVNALVYGASISISEQTIGLLSTYASWPLSEATINVDTIGLGRAIAAGDQIIVRQNLCSSQSPPTTSSSTVISCNEVPAPSIEPPRDGDDFIIIKKAIPGATIRVTAIGPQEIGDGAGDLIALTRPLYSGETIIVSQQLGDCEAAQAIVYQVP